MALSQAELRAIATLDGSQFKAGMAEIKGSVKEFATGGIKELGGMIGKAFAVGAIINFGNVLMEEAAQLERFSKTVNMSVSMLNELGDIATATGADGDGFNQKIVKMLEAQEKAIAGNEELITTFKRLSISLSDLESKTPDELLKAVAAGAQTDASAIRDLNAVMGRGAAAEYGATLRELAANGLPQIDAAAESGIHRLAQAKKSISTLWSNIKDKATIIAGTVIDRAYGLTDQDSQISSQVEAIDRRRKAEEALAGLKLQHDEAVDKIKLEGQKKTDAVDKKRAKEIDDITVSGPKAVSGMAEYGRMMGSSFGGSGGVAERQLKELEIIARYAEESAKIADETAKKIEALGGE